MRVFCIVEVVVLILGLLVALMRTTEAPALFPVRLMATVYTDVFRGIPTILLVYLVGFGIPALDLSGLPTEPVVLGGIALTLSYGAYVSEVYRAGLRSVHRGQRDAALAIGLTERQAMRYVILPQAVRRVGPPLLNDFIALQKDVALIAIIGVAGEAFRVAQIDAVDRLQLHADGRRGAALPGGDDPAGPAARALGLHGGGDVSAAARRCSSSAASPRRSASARSCTGSTSRSPSTRRSR